MTARRPKSTNKTVHRKPRSRRKHRSNPIDTMLRKTGIGGPAEVRSYAGYPDPELTRQLSEVQPELAVRCSECGTPIPLVTEIAKSLGAKAGNVKMKCFACWEWKPRTLAERLREVEDVRMPDDVVARVTSRIPNAEEFRETFKTQVFNAPIPAEFADNRFTNEKLGEVVGPILSDGRWHTLKKKSAAKKSLWRKLWDGELF